MVTLSTGTSDAAVFDPERNIAIRGVFLENFVKVFLQRNGSLLHLYLVF